MRMTVRPCREEKSTNVEQRFRQELLGEVGRELETINNWAQNMLRGCDRDDLRRDSGETIVCEIAALHKYIADSQCRTHASVEVSGSRTGPFCPAAER